MRPYIVIGLLTCLLALSAHNKKPYSLLRSSSPAEQNWVDSVFETMTERQRIGQLFMIRAHSDKDSVFEAEVDSIIRTFEVGGLCFFQGTPEKQAVLTNRYQNSSPKLPLLVAMDAEWGLGMRLKSSTMSFPKQLTLGAISDNRLIYEMGKEVARQCRRLGVHVNFAPVADINNNPDNPVINSRSFGEDRFNVTAKCFQYMMGMQDAGVMACAKHFPGHGDTDIDSHLELPLIIHAQDRLDSLELFPFRVLSQYGIGSMMVAHLNVPALDDRAKRPTTLSHPVIHDLLRKKIGFQGLVFTDAMEMKAVTKYFGPGQADLEALRAGNDMILLPANIGESVMAIETALEDGSLDREELHQSVKRVLRAKYRLGLNKPQQVQTKRIRKDLHPVEGEMLRRKLIEEALTLVRDDHQLAGFPNLESLRIASLAIGDTTATTFQQVANRYAPMQLVQSPWETDSIANDSIIALLDGYDVVLISLHLWSIRAQIDYGITDQAIDLVQQLNKKHRVILHVFGNPYSLRHFDEVPSAVVAYQDDATTQSLAAQALFGARNYHGKLPITASSKARFGQGIVKNAKFHRLRYDLPESVGMSSDTLAQIDSLAYALIAAGASPGCQILVARHGSVIWNKGYGYYTYTDSIPVTPETIFDLASVTKVAATTLAVMRESDLGRMDICNTVSTYLPELKSSNKDSITLEEMMTHHGALQAWIPFYKETLDKNGAASNKIYSSGGDSLYCIPVARDFYMCQPYTDTLWKRIFDSELRTSKSYRYSDLGLYLTARSVERASHKSLDEYVDKAFYKPLGLATTCYNPWLKGLTDRCPPTEEDGYFRGQRLQGYVHDMGAAMLGGVSGHAGLFSNANDLAKIFEMLLRGGQYGGRRYLNANTILYFTSRFRESSRRGVGFDMKELDVHASQNMCWEASPSTFGHLGFTGNAVWADPEKDLIYIFLSNRTYPTMENKKLITGNYRPRIQQVVYKAIQQ